MQHDAAWMQSTQLQARQPGRSTEVPVALVLRNLAYPRERIVNQRKYLARLNVAR